MNLSIKKKWLVSAVGCLLAFGLFGCSNQLQVPQFFRHSKAEPVSSTSQQRVSGETMGKIEGLRSLSQDKTADDGSGSFHITGDFVKATKNTIVIDAENNHITLKKAAAFRLKLMGFRKNIKGYKVVCKMNAKDGTIQELAPAPITLADKNGVYEQYGQGRENIIGRLLAEDRYKLIIEVPMGQVVFDKLDNFKTDDSAQSQNLIGKIVRLRLIGSNAAELSYSWIDQE